METVNSLPSHPSHPSQSSRKKHSVPKSSHKQLIIKSGDLKRFHLNLEYIHDTHISEWNDPLEHMYHICDFILYINDNNKGCLGDIERLISLINTTQTRIDSFEEQQLHEESQMDPLWLEFYLRAEMITDIQNTIEFIESYASIEESS